jgi:asparagine synthase (glutamine-hydrolysing)
MCGIAVAVSWPNAHDIIAQLVQGIFHRGDITDPIFSPKNNIAMCTRRLRIVDADHAVQPQLSHDGRLAVSFNGEIYNYREIRQELIAAGVRFKTESDTEVLANALRVWGPAALERLVGMYAFVAIDIETGDFIAARDPFGVKPLYLIQTEFGLIFCSEIRPLLATIEFGDVLLLPPGYMLTREKCCRFKSPLHALHNPVAAGSVRTLDRLLAEAVHKRIPGDLPVALMFSGGIDSTLVVHYTRQLRPNAPGYFAGSVDAPDYRYAAEYAELTKLDLRLVPFDPESDEAFAQIDRVIEVTESFEPSLLRGAAHSLAAAKQMHRDGFRVAMCGEGADELFCGYAPLEIAFQDNIVTGCEIRNECLGLMNRVNLQRVDRCSMRYQIEMREPFLDPAIANYALNLGAGALVRDVNGKATGKAALRDVYNLYPDTLPASIRDRSKVPFGATAIREEASEDLSWKARFEETLSDRDLFEGKMEFEGFAIESKEELYYLRKLSRVMNLARVPHLRGRAWISFPMGKYAEQLKAYKHYAV